LANKKILFFTLGKEYLASSRTRVYGYLPYLQNAGFDCSIIASNLFWYHQTVIFGKNSYLVKVINRIYNLISGLRVILRSRSFNIIFIQRVLLPVPVFKILHRFNPNIIFDFDDAVHLADTHYNPKGTGRKFLTRFNYIAKNSKAVITTQSEFNQSHARLLNENVFGLTTPVNIKRYYPKQDVTGGEVVIGWIGSPEATPFLYSLKDVFRVISKRHPNLKLELIGAKKFKIDGLDPIFKDWDLRTEAENLHHFDIGIMPLEDNAWTRNKYYKLLQYFAAGIPAVASGIGICRDMIEDGVNGFLAKDNDEWIQKLSLLIENSELRKRIGVRARKTAEDFYSYEVTAPVLIGILKKLNSNG
jgi:glycosyltransferase involved in cell wall biosynthesis